MIFSFLDGIILTLAVFRITRLATTDEIFSKIREKVWSKSPPHKGGIGYLITCDWCTSIWVSSLVLIVYKIEPTPAVTVLSVFALSGAAGLLSRISQH
jgi:hypothetical protein